MAAKHTNEAIRDAYDEGMRAVQKILFSTKSTAIQRKTAKQTLKDLTAMLLANTLKTVEGRTALLSGLIVELNQVIDKVQTKPPFSNAMSGLTTTLTKAHKLLNGTKKGLLSDSDD